MIDGRNVFDQAVKNDRKAQEKFRKVITGQKDTYIKVYGPDYLYFIEFRN